MERWYRFSARGSKPLYSYVTLAEAFDFAERLNRARDITYSTRMLTGGETQELGLEDNTEAFSLTIGTKPSFEREVSGCFGVMPNFFCSAPAAPGLIEELWVFAKSAYIDSPLPSLFKERLFVHLSRFCEVRYCIVRHVGFLIGEGRPAGDPKVKPETIEQVITLLRRPLPDANALAGVFARLESHEEPRDIPAPGTQAEYDLFDALSVMFLKPRRWERAREAVRRAVGDGTLEILMAFLAFVRTAHYWTETHPELAIEPDMLSVLEQHEGLARLLLDPSDAEYVKADEALRQTLAGM